MIETPCAASSAMRTARRSNSAGVRLEVGSSMARTLASSIMARAISTIWRWATLRVRMGAAGSIVGSSGARACGGRLLLPAARHEQAARGFQRVAEEHVLSDGELGNVLELLMDHRDPGATGRYRPVPGRTRGRRSPRAPKRD